MISYPLSTRCQGLPRQQPPTASTITRPARLAAGQHVSHQGWPRPRRIHVRMASTMRPLNAFVRPQGRPATTTASGERAQVLHQRRLPLGVGTTSRTGLPASGARADRRITETYGLVSHARPAAERYVVHGVVHVGRPASQVVHAGSRSPRAAAFPISETRSGLSKYSGKIVTMSMRSPTPSPLF